MAMIPLYCRCAHCGDEYYHIVGGTDYCDDCDTWGQDFPPEEVRLYKQHPEWTTEQIAAAADRERAIAKGDVVQVAKKQMSLIA